MACRPAASGGFGLSPSEFWRMHPREFWWLVESRKPAKMYGSMTPDQVEELYEETFGDGE